MIDAHMDHPTYQQLKELAWRRPLHPDEQARLETFLAANPEGRGDWELDLQLTRQLGQLPSAPVSSNFTARVMQAAMRPAPVQKTGWLQRLALPRWLPRYAMVMALVALAGLSVHQYQTLQNSRNARDLAQVTRVAALPEMDWFQDFETINRLSQVQVADNDLLTTLQ